MVMGGPASGCLPHPRVVGPRPCLIPQYGRCAWCGNGGPTSQLFSLSRDGRPAPWLYASMQWQSDLCAVLLPCPVSFSDLCAFHFLPCPVRTQDLRAFLPPCPDSSSAIPFYLRPKACAPSALSPMLSAFPCFTQCTPRPVRLPPCPISFGAMVPLGHRCIWYGQS